MADTDFDYGWFDNTQQPPTEECGGTVECSVCGKFHGWCNELDKLKENSMLPAADSTSGRGARSGQAKNSNRLRVDDLSKDPVEAKILMVKSDLDGKYGAQVIAKIAIKGDTKFWYLDIKKNPNYRLMVAKFGQDENEWVDQRILLGLEKDDFNDQFFVRVTFPAKEKRARE